MNATAEDFEIEPEPNRIDEADVYRVWHPSAPNLVTRLRDNGTDVITEPTADCEQQQSDAVIRDAQQALGDHLLTQDNKAQGYAYVVAGEIEFDDHVAEVMADDGFDVSIISWGNGQ